MAKQTGQIVFVVDDEQQAGEGVFNILEDSGITARHFADPAECLDQIASGGCDLLIIDLTIPATNSIELMLQVKKLVPWLPVVIVTACGDIPTAVKAVHAGAADFIKKPLVKDDFIKMVRSLLPSDDNSLRCLTRNEARVLRLVAMGRSSSEIAHIMHRSPRTIETHRTHAMDKLGLQDFTDLLRRIGGIGVPEFLKDYEEKTAGTNHDEDGQ